MPSSWTAALIGAGLLLTSSPVPAQEPEGETVGGRTYEVFPSSLPYRPYRADPRTPEFGLLYLAYSDANIADSGSRRSGLKLGGRFGLLNIHPRDRPEDGWQIDIEAGFSGQFDIDHSLDNIGWDGTYAFLVSHPLTSGVAIQLGTKHISSHVGDEYAERTGRRRVEYTREEATAGVSWTIDKRRRTYAEAGWGYATKDQIGQEPGRLQVGFEYQELGEFRVPGGRLGWYAASNVESMEEQDWEPDIAVQAGLLVPAGDRRWRVGIGYYTGRVPLGEFFQEEEDHFTFGLWLEP